MNIKLDIPESFYKGEELCGYYVSPKMKKVWAVQLDLINEFARVCSKHNIRWWMDAGTLLGAVRHKGFIPWDHDSDVMMMREDFERFCSVASEEFHYPYNFMASSARLLNEDTAQLDSYIRRVIAEGLSVRDELGIYIDVFPIDKIPDDERETRRIVRKMKIYSYLDGRISFLNSHYAPTSPCRWKRYLKSFLHSVLMHIPLNYGYFREKYIAAAQTYNGLESEHVAKLCMAGDPNFMKRRVWKRAYFDGTTYFPFEMLTLPAPSGWEDVLNTFYGDWHKFVIRKIDGIVEPETYFYDPEHSYRYYTQEGHPINEDEA